MTHYCSLFTLVVLTLLALTSRAEAQFDHLDYATPDAFFVDIENPNNSASVGDCGIVVPSWPEALLVDCQLNGTPTALQVWKGLPVAGGMPAAVLPYGGGTVSVPNPSANLVHEMEAGSLYLEVLGAAGTLGQGPIGRPQGQSFTRVTLNGAGHLPPNPTTATGSCDLLVMNSTTTELEDEIDRDGAFYECRHNVPNAQFGQLRRGSPGGSIIVDFSDQVANPIQRGVFRSPQDRDALLNGEVFAVIDESFSGARIAGRAGCWSGEQASGDQALCLNDNRFKVDVHWMTAAGDAGSGMGSFLGQNGDTGAFWFLDPENVELVVEVIDACDLEGFNNFWVFAAGLTDVEVTLTVTDTQTNAVETYMNPLNTPFQPIRDTTAFATCP